jgi:hypothetical protein
MKLVKFVLKMFVLSYSRNGYIHNFYPHPGKTENEDPVVLKILPHMSSWCGA